MSVNENTRALFVATLLCLMVIIPFLILSISRQPSMPDSAANAIPTQEKNPQITAKTSMEDGFLITSTPDEDRQSTWANVYIGVTAFGLLVAFVGLLASYKTNEYGGKISAYQKVQIANMNRDAKQADERTAELRARNLVLASRIAPRSLPDPLFIKMLGNLPAFRGSTVRVSSYSLDVESANLGLQILRLIEKLEIIPQNDILSQSALGSLSTGVLVSGKNENLVLSLLEALNKIGILAGPGSPPPFTGISLGNGFSEPDAMIFVGTKPLPPPNINGDEK